MTKQQKIIKMWSALEDYKKTAEQHQFVTLMAIDCLFGPAYLDLQANWNEEHADSFIKGMNMIFERLKIKFEDD